MIALPQHRLDALLARHELVESELASGLSADAYVKLEGFAAAEGLQL